MKNEKVIGSMLNSSSHCRDDRRCGSSDSGSGSDGSSAKTAKVIDVDLTSEEYAFGVDQTQPELLEQVNAFIAKIQEDERWRKSLISISATASRRR